MKVVYFYSFLLAGCHVSCITHPSDAIALKSLYSSLSGVAPNPCLEFMKEEDPCAAASMMRMKCNADGWVTYLELQSCSLQGLFALLTGVCESGERERAIKNSGGEVRSCEIHLMCTVEGV